jgi:hypothetical protein
MMNTLFCHAYLNRNPEYGFANNNPLHRIELYAVNRIQGMVESSCKYKDATEYTETHITNPHFKVVMYEGAVWARNFLEAEELLKVHNFNPSTAIDITNHYSGTCIRKDFAKNRITKRYGFVRPTTDPK